MSLKFCANLSFMFQESSSLIERYSLASKAGFKAVECGFPYDYTIEEIVKAKTEARVEQVLINAFAGDSSKGDFGYAAIPGKEELFDKSIKESIKYAKALNCKRIHVMAGTVQSPVKENDDTYEKNIKTASELLEKEGIIGVIEPINKYAVPNYYLNNYERAISVIKKVNSPFIKLQLDLFHLQHIKGDLTSSIKEFLPYAGHIQIAQVPERHEPNTPGEINYKYIFSLLKQHNYNGFVGLEYRPAGDSVKGLTWIQEFGFQM